MVNKIVGWVVLVPISLGLVVLALANRHFVVINFNPFAPGDVIAAPGYGVPLFVVLYVVLLIGVLAGGIATRFAQTHHRRREKHWRREAQTLTGELENLRKTKRGSSSAATDADDLLELR
ncbi:MAG: DUF1049 domain-containing protein [Candidatus Devosia euplotis]|nr:DUF1049 domain-containing protein [Candidatus Devosia euplotis]